MVEKEDLPVIEKLIHSMSEALEKLEEAQQKKDKTKFNEAKRLIIHLQEKIEELLR